jgi:type II secretory pathway pseudopilin PulG
MAANSRTGRSETPRRASQRGAVLLMVLLFILVVTAGASSFAESMRGKLRREKEEELLFVGDQYRRAIASYYGMVPPGGRRSLPQNLEDLISDSRFPTPVQHLRRMYPDPLTSKVDWIVLTAPAGGIVGVKSPSAGSPMKVSGFPPLYSSFAGHTWYAQWEFRVQYP